MAAVTVVAGTIIHARRDSNVEYMKNVAVCFDARERGKVMVAGFAMSWRALIVKLNRLECRFRFVGSRQGLFLHVRSVPSVTSVCVCSVCVYVYVVYAIVWGRRRAYIYTHVYFCVKMACTVYGHLPNSNVILREYDERVSMLNK